MKLPRRTPGTTRPVTVRAGRSIAFVTTVTLATVFAFGTTAHAADPVTVKGQELRDGLFVASARVHTQGPTGLKDLVLSAEMLGYRQTHPAATTAEMRAHTTTMGQWYDSQLTTVDANRQVYELLPHVLTRMSGHPLAALATPVMRDLTRVVISPNVKSYSDRIDQVATAQFSYDQFQRWFPAHDLVWQQVTTRAQSDASFAAAWDESFGQRLGVGSTASTEQLASDPLIAANLNLNAILAYQADKDSFIAAAKAQIQNAIAVIEDLGTGMATAVGTFAGQYPLNAVGAPRPTPDVHQQAQAAAGDRQKIIDGAGGAVDVLARIIGWADPRSGRIAAGVGKSALQIATAINKYIPSIAGLSLGQALTSMSTVALTGNIIGAIGALLPVLADMPSMDQMLMNEMRKLRQQVADLAATMNTRFDRIDRALAVLYTSMLEKFDEMLALQNATLAQLANIEHTLYDLNTTINNWGADIMEAIRENMLQPVEETINRGVNHVGKFGEPIPTYDRYLDYESPLQLFASSTAYRTPFTVPDPASYNGRDPLVTLNEFKLKGSIAYLDWYARQYHGFTGPSVNRPADAAGWTVAARAYGRLVAENPDYARRVAEERLGGVLGGGQSILEATRQFSRPLSTPDANGTRTNALYTNLLNDYTTTMRDYSARLGVIRGPNPENKNYDMFGAGDQLPNEARVSDSATISPCTGTNPALTRPTPARFADTPNSLLFARYAHPDRPVVKLCYSASFTNVETAWDHKWYYEYGDLNIVVRTWVQWAGQEFDYNSWSTTFPIGEYCRRYVSGAPGGTCRDVKYYLNQNWNSSYLTSFNNGSVLYQVDQARANWAKDRMTDYFMGRQKVYYGNVWTELNTVGSDLFTLNAKLTKYTRLLQAYTQLGWAKALQQDDLLGLQTFGVERLPADWGDLPFISSAFARAHLNYAACTVHPNGACGAGVPVVNPLANQPYLPSSCNTNGYVGRSGDPVGDCILATAAVRGAALAARFAQHSRELHDGTYVEGMPDVQAIVDELSLANIVVRRT